MALKFRMLCFRKKLWKSGAYWGHCYIIVDYWINGLHYCTLLEHCSTLFYTTEAVLYTIVDYWSAAQHYCILLEH